MEQQITWDHVWTEHMRGFIRQNKINSITGSTGNTWNNIYCNEPMHRNIILIRKYMQTLEWEGTNF